MQKGIPFNDFYRDFFGCLSVVVYGVALMSYAGNIVLSLNWKLISCLIELHDYNKASCEAVHCRIHVLQRSKSLIVPLFHRNLILQPYTLITLNKYMNRNFENRHKTETILLMPLRDNRFTFQVFSTKELFLKAILVFLMYEKLIARKIDHPCLLNIRCCQFVLYP